MEGYGIGDAHQIEIMANESPKMVREIDSWGANFAKLKNGKLDQRFLGLTNIEELVIQGDYTGLSIIRTLIKKANKLNIPIYDDQYVTDLLVKDGICFGAMSFDINSSERTVHYADAIVLCTGGHTKIWKKKFIKKA